MDKLKSLGDEGLRQLFPEEENFAEGRCLLDDSENFMNNEIKAIDRINDDMSFADVRELFLGMENNQVREAYEDAREQRIAFSAGGNVRNLA